MALWFSPAARNMSLKKRKLDIRQLPSLHTKRIENNDFKGVIVNIHLKYSNYVMSFLRTPLWHANQFHNIQFNSLPWSPSLPTQMSLSSSRLGIRLPLFALLVNLALTWKVLLQNTKLAKSGVRQLYSRLCVVCCHIRACLKHEMAKWRKGITSKSQCGIRMSVRVFNPYYHWELKPLSSQWYLG